MEHYFDLGSHSRPITTSSEGAQLWFNRVMHKVWAPMARPSRALLDALVQRSPKHQGPAELAR